MYQGEPGSSLDEEGLSRLSSLNGDFICFPEYFFIPRGVRSQRGAASSFPQMVGTIQALSAKLGLTVIGGSLVELVNKRTCNTTYIFNRGRMVGRYRKIHLWGREKTAGLSRGGRYRAFDVEGVRIGVLICADALFPRSFLKMGELGAHIVFVPTTSLYRHQDSPGAKFNRDEKIFVNGALISQSYVVKVGAVGSVFGRPLQGRSLIASPQGVLCRVAMGEEREKKILVYDLPLSHHGQKDFL